MLLLLLLLCVHRCNCIVMPKLKNEYKNNHFIYRRNSFVFNDDDNITQRHQWSRAHSFYFTNAHRNNTFDTCCMCNSPFNVFRICYNILFSINLLLSLTFFLRSFFWVVFCIRCAFVLACYKQRDRTSNIRIWSTSMNFTDDDIEWAWQSSMYSSYDPYRWQWNCS